MRRAASRQRALGVKLRTTATIGCAQGTGRLHRGKGGAARTCTSLSMKRSNASTYSTGRIAVWSYMAAAPPLPVASGENAGNFS